MPLLIVMHSILTIMQPTCIVPIDDVGSVCGFKPSASGGTTAYWDHLYAGRLFNDLSQRMSDGLLEERMWAKTNRGKRQKLTPAPYNGGYIPRYAVVKAELAD